MSILESTRKMTTNEKMCYDMGYAQGKQDAVPMVRGEWKLYGNDDDSGMSYWCTACNFQLSEDLFYSGYKNGRWIENGVFKYCPNCGARMDGAE